MVPDGRRDESEVKPLRRRAAPSVTLRAVMLPLPPAAVLARRVPRVMVGLVLFGAGIAFTAISELGLSPWDVFAQGIARRSAIGLGAAGIIVGAAVLLLWIPLKERPGLGTILNVAVIGVVTDLTLYVFPDEAGSTAWRWTALLGGIALIGLGTGLYIGAGLGPGPRDGLMTALARRGISIRRARTSIEVAVLAVGWLLGGTVGIGTVVFALGVGPAVHYSFGRTAVVELATDA